MPSESFLFYLGDSHITPLCTVSLFRVYSAATIRCGRHHTGLGTSHSPDESGRISCLFFAFTLPNQAAYWQCPLPTALAWRSSNGPVTRCYVNRDYQDNMPKHCIRQFLPGFQYSQGLPSHFCHRKLTTKRHKNLVVKVSIQTRPKPALVLSSSTLQYVRSNV